ncbi:hypothetical protein [Sinorhizobium sp. BG8]|uniref:hypothetical protein n=1 Tax=Sinorhizobium sp. BG8 TaxID=2613773 RepID=UPI00193DC967|nr:hypothetical protein [Sinorhizobium sp. BG8]QRM53177.1 hypothetical protein F3Y30_00310 [Sinorhizobium sp. BG8]
MQLDNRSVASFKLPATLTIRSILDVKANILSQIDENNAISLEFEDDTQVDLSFVQLLEAARTYSQLRGKTLNLAKPASGSLLDVLRRGGFLDSISPDASKFWLHQETAQ